MKVGIVGNGFVGNALYENFKDVYETLVYDKDEKRRKNSLEEVYRCEVIFICLPTPMIDADGGECNLSIIENFFEQIPRGIDSIFVIKSTVPVGTTKNLSKLRKDLKIIHNPEFLTAANAKEDFKRSERNIFGGHREHCEKVSEVLKRILPGVQSFIVSSEESETIKYVANIFLTLKISYFNLIFDFCESREIDYDNVVLGVTSDSRIGKSHTQVPGPDGQRGFGGTCFPKDLNSFIDLFEKENIDNAILRQVWDYNKKIRKEWDWKQSSSAVMKKD